MADNQQTAAPPATANWPVLLPGETLQWEGRPAPRCFTFRNWRQALFGLVLTGFCAAWTWMGVEQAAEQGWPWLAWLPLPFLGYALWLAGGQLLAARLEWRNIAYAVTDRRVIARHGLFTPRQVELNLARVTWFRLQPQGEELGSLRVHGAADDPVLLMYCIEYPRRPASLLAAAINAKEQSKEIGARNKEQG
jgi:hypothetical protein